MTNEITPEDLELLQQTAKEAFEIFKKLTKELDSKYKGREHELIFDKLLQLMLIDSVIQYIVLYNKDARDKDLAEKIMRMMMPTFSHTIMCGIENAQNIQSALENIH